MSLFFSLLFIVLIAFSIWFLLRFNRKPKYTDPFNLYFGSPGCGKTTFLVADAINYNKMGYNVFSNISLKFPKFNNCFFDKTYIGNCLFPEKSILLFDEGSLNGFDNRDHRDNFKDKDSLVYLKTIRHYKNAIIFYNQGFDELDKKIRILCNRVWIVKKIGPFSMAILIKKKVEIDKETHDIKDGYYKPSVFSLIFCPSVVRIIFRPMFYKYFDSYSKMDIGLVPYSEFSFKK